MIRGNNITNSRGWVPNGTLWMRFNCCPNLMFLASPWLKIQIFKLIILLTLSSSKLIVFKNKLLVHFYWLWVGHGYFIEFLQDGRPWKCKLSPFDKNFKNHTEDLAQVIFNDSIIWNQLLDSPVNKQNSKVQSFILFCNRK